MILNEKHDAKIQRAQKKLREISIQHQYLTQQYQQLLTEFNLTQEELKENGENIETYSPEIREDLLLERQKIEEDLNQKLSLIPDQEKAKKTMSEKATIQQHWLYVR